MTLGKGSPQYAAAMLALVFAACGRSSFVPSEQVGDGPAARDGGTHVSDGGDGSSAPRGSHASMDGGAPASNGGSDGVAGGGGMSVGGAGAGGADSGGMSAGGMSPGGMSVGGTFAFRGGAPPLNIGGAPSPPLLASRVGAPCDTQADCDSGLDCLTQDSNQWFDGGPAHGMCTLPCALDLDCTDVDPTTTCVSDGLGGYCFPACRLGTPLVGDNKCLGRGDMACSGVPGSRYACLPTCGGDYDCNGRICDTATGVCVDSGPGSKQVGEECDLFAAERECAGGCLELAPGYAVCTGICTFGVSNCGLDPREDFGAGDPVCLPLDASGGILDVGFCVQRCDCNDDCASASAVCDPFDDPATETAVGALGLCIPSSLTDAQGNPITGLACP